MPKGDNPKSRANLIPKTTLSTEEARKMQKRSAEVRREAALKRKSMKATLGVLLDKSLRKGKVVTPEEIQSMAEVADLNLDVNTAINIAIIQRALMGDVQSAQYIRDTIGEKPKDKVEVDQSLTIESWAKEHKVKL